VELFYETTRSLAQLHCFRRSQSRNDGAYHYLNQHPQIYMTPLKETNFFALEGQPLNFSGPGDEDYVNRMSITSLERYKEQFDGVRDEIAVGEASPLYLTMRVLLATSSATCPMPS
jgi:hypothetical protein